MPETGARSEIIEDVARMSPSDTASSPDYSKMSHNGQATEEREIGSVNLSVDEDEGVR